MSDMSRSAIEFGPDGHVVEMPCQRDGCEDGQIPAGMYCCCGCGKRVSKGRYWARGHQGPPRPARPLADRFVEKVAPGDPDDCWPWMGTLDSKGYGVVQYRGKSVKAHRIAYELANSPILFGLWVLHSCDNPPCCNPAHLRLGTAVDNVQDKVSRMRQMHGEGAYQHKLTVEDVKAIRAASARGARHVDLAREYGVSDTNIACVVYRRTWRHVPAVAA